MAQAPGGELRGHGSGCGQGAPDKGSIHFKDTELEGSVNIQERASSDSNRWHRLRGVRRNLKEVTWRDLGPAKELARAGDPERRTSRPRKQDAPQ